MVIGVQGAPLPHDDRHVLQRGPLRPAQKSITAVLELIPLNVGTWLSLVEHLVRDQGVGGSNPLVPTFRINEVGGSKWPAFFYVHTVLSTYHPPTEPGPQDRQLINLP